MNLSQITLILFSSHHLWYDLIQKVQCNPQDAFGVFIPSRITPEDNHSTAGGDGISPKELQIHLKSIKHLMEGTKWTELPESLAFEGRHPAKCHLLLHMRNYYPAFRAGFTFGVH